MTSLARDAAADAHLESIHRLCAEIETLADSARRVPAVAESVSYDVFFDPLRVFAAIGASVHRLLDDLRPTATVRTRLDDGESAITVLNYTGLAASAWPVNPSAALAVAQLTSLQRIFALRVALARAMVAAGGALASLAAGAVNPLALPHLLFTARSLQDALERLIATAEAAA